LNFKFKGQFILISFHILVYETASVIILQIHNITIVNIELCT